MHDPMTVAFSIRRPWAAKRRLLGGDKYYPELFTIWHVDPETDGSDDSCDWFYWKLTPAERLAGLDLMTNEVDNLNTYYREMDVRDQEMVMLAQWRRARQFYKPRPWYKHPRWHIHHWRVQWHFGQTLHRWLLSRCAKCGRRFPWGYSPIGPWNSPKRHWWQGEIGVMHHECDDSRRQP
jgi:hypothetical protein